MMPSLLSHVMESSLLYRMTSWVLTALTCHRGESWVNGPGGKVIASAADTNEIWSRTRQLFPASQGGACILAFNCVDWMEWVTERVSNEKPLHPQDQRLMLLSGVHAISLPLKFHGSDFGKEELVLEKMLLLDSWQSSVFHDDGSRWVLSSASSSLKRQV